MAFADFQGRTEELFELGTKAWRWWLAELWVGLPEGLRSRLASKNGYVTVDFNGDGIVVSRTAPDGERDIFRLGKEDVELPDFVAAVGEALGKICEAGDDFVIRFPYRDVLRRRLQLPLAAARNLAEILAHELDRQSPIDPAQVYFDYEIKARNKEKGKIDVELRILKREAVDRAAAFCQSLGIAAPTIRFLDGDQEVQTRDFVADRSSAVAARWKSWMTPALCALVLVLSVGTLIAALSRKQDELDALMPRVHAAKSQARTVIDLKEQIGAAEEQIGFLPARKQSPLLAKVLTDVTHTLPDGTWIFEFELDGRKVRIRGYSPSASKLIALFDNSPEFENAEFQSSLMQGPSKELERFDLSFDIKDRRS